MSHTEIRFWADAHELGLVIIHFDFVNLYPLCNILDACFHFACCAREVLRESRTVQCRDMCTEMVKSPWLPDHSAEWLHVHGEQHWSEHWALWDTVLHRWWSRPNAINDNRLRWQTCQVSTTWTTWLRTVSAQPKGRKQSWKHNFMVNCVLKLVSLFISLITTLSILFACCDTISFNNTLNILSLQILIHNNRCATH